MNWFHDLFIEEAKPALERHSGGISSGSGGATTKAPIKDVNFYDYDGTRLYSYTLAEARALTKLPELPIQPGLMCQGWNWTLEDIKDMNRAVDVGAMYITDDGKTRLYITIATEGRMNVPLYFQQTVANGVAIDWGDGSVMETLAGTGKVNTAHAYTSIGDYVITLDVADGCTFVFGDGSKSYCVMGSTGDNGKVNINMLQKVEIGKGVTNIGSYAFYSCYSLASITIPNSVTSIDPYAFNLCYSLASVTIPNGVTRIANYAFNCCYALARIAIPNGVTSIGDNAFYYCYSLARVTMPDGVTNIGTNAFCACNSLASVIIPGSVTSIASKVFYNCYGLAHVTISSGVKSIVEYMFNGCYSLASITIPNSVTSIGGGAFNLCYSLASVTIPNSVTSIGGNAFLTCYGMAFYDFTSHTAVPTLANTNAFSQNPSDFEIRVPAALYDEWIAATNWANYASKIIAV